jgi:hypothetical protein
MVLEPALRATRTPPGETTATSGFDDVHEIVAPVAVLPRAFRGTALKRAESPTVIGEMSANSTATTTAGSGGGALTETLTTSEAVPDTAEMRAVPWATPTTVPVGSTVATAGSLLDQRTGAFRIVLPAWSRTVAVMAMLWPGRMASVRDGAS